MMASVRVRRFWPELVRIAALLALLSFIIALHRYVM